MVRRIALPVAACLYLISTTAAAAWQLWIDRVETPAMSLAGVDLRIAAAAPGRLTLHLRIATADLPGLGVRRQRVQADCELARESARWLCKGSAQFGETPSGSVELAAAFDDTELSLRLERAATKATITQQRRAADEWRMVISDLPLAWFNSELTSAWPQSKQLAGRADMDARVRLTETATRVEGSYALRELGFDTTDGHIAAAHLAAKGKLNLQWDPQGMAFDHSGTLNNGEILFGAFYAQAPDNPLRVDLRGRRGGDGVWGIESVRLEDPQVLTLQAIATIDPTQSQPVRELSFNQLDLHFPQAYTRYAQSWLAPRSLGELQVRGRALGSLRIDGKGVAAVTVQAQELGIDDAQGRAAVLGLNGAIDWRRDETAPASSFSWQSAQLYRIPLDAAKWNLRSIDGALILQEATRLPILGGAIQIAQLTFRPAAERSERFRAALAMHGIDMALLSKALDWPAFGGTLGGGIPDLRYRDNTLELGGGLMLNVFDGTVNVTGLRIERPFGVAPTLVADIDFANLDLKLLTGTFDFGEITGRLTGAVRSLRMLDWSPVAFDADLHALGGGKISQRAVKNLSSVGGGGIAAGLQASMMRIFDQFGYARLGLRCRLANNVCRMSGLDSAGQGYSIVEGRGLPRISIVGHQSEVDWTVLLERLKAATSGTAPIIE